MLTQGSFKTHLGAQLLLARAFIPLERFSTFTDAVSDPVFPEPALVMFSQRCDLARLHMHPGSVSLMPKHANGRLRPQHLTICLCL